MSAINDLFEVARLVGKGLVGELGDSDFHRGASVDAAAPPAPEAPSCPRCDGVGEVALRAAGGATILGPCPVCGGKAKV